MKIVEPTAAAHAAVTSLTLQARLHTVSMMEPEGRTWAYDQIDRHQRNTSKETSGAFHHDGETGKAPVMMQQMQEAARFVNVNVDFTVASEHKIIITPGPDSNDQLERICSQYCRFLRRGGETGLSCHFVHSPPYRPNPILQYLKSLLEYTPDVQQGTTRWPVASARATNGIPIRERGQDSGQTFLATALAGTGRFRPPLSASDEATLAPRSTNTELAKNNADLKQQLALLGEQQLALRVDTEQRSAAFIEEQRVQIRKFQEEMRELHQANAERKAATQRQLGTLIREVTALPEGAQVLRNALAPANLLSATDAGTTGAPEAGSRRRGD